MTNTACNCLLSDIGAALLDAVVHYAPCSLLANLDALATGTLIPEGHVKPWSEWTCRDDRELLTEN